MSLLDKIAMPPLALNTAQVADESKKFILIYSKDIPQEEQAALQAVGTVLQWKDNYVNLPFEQLAPFDYLLIDVRSKNARLTLGREALDKYNVVCYVSWIQKGIEEFTDQVKGVEVTSIPLHAVNKADMDNMLLNKKLVQPSLLKSFFLLALSCLRK